MTIREVLEEFGKEYERVKYGKTFETAEKFDLVRKNVIDQALSKIKELMLTGFEISHILQGFTKEDKGGEYYYIHGKDFIRLVEALIQTRDKKMGGSDDKCEH